MVRNILVGYDGTRPADVAVAQAIALAELAGGRIHLANVTPVTEDAGPDGGEAESDLATLALGQSEREVGTELADDALQPVTVEEIHRRCQDLHVVCEDEQLFGRHPGMRLLRRSWLAELLVIGRGRERRSGQPGPNATFLLTELVAPTLVAARQYVELRTVLMPYKLSVDGGRGLSFAAQLCQVLNAQLEVLICEPRRTEAHEARAAVERFLRAYHVESSTDVALAAPHEAVHSAALERASSLVIVPGAHKRNYVLPWQRNETLWRALEVPGAAVLAYP